MRFGMPWSGPETSFGLVYPLLLVTFAAPLAYGGKLPWVWGLIEVVAFVSAGLALLLANSRREFLRVLRSVPIGLLLVSGGFAVIQIVPMPMVMIDVLSPRAFAYAQAAGATDWATLSINPDASLTFLLQLGAYLCAAILIASVVDSPGRLKILLLIVIAAALLNVLIGFVFSLSAGDLFMPNASRGIPTNVKGTYVNGSHFGALAAIGACLVGGWAASLRHNNRADNLALAGIILAVLLLGVLASYSRGAVLSLALVGIVFAVLQDKRHLKTWLALVLLAVVGGGAWILLTDAQVLLSRWSNFESADSRLVIWRMTLEMAADFPLFGHGGGSYEYLSDVYKPADFTTKYINHAHNDHLEWIAGFGLVSYAAAIAAMVWLIRGALNVDSRLVLGVAAAMVYLLVHGLSDFNFYIPANALIFATLVGVLLRVHLQPRAFVD